MNKTLKQNNYLYLLLGTAISALIVGLTWGNFEQIKKSFGYSIIDNPPGCRTATASTTLNSLISGRGTTTLPCRVSSATTAILNLTILASSTPLSELTYKVERSVDGTNYFQDTIKVLELATTTQLTAANNKIKLLASTTLPTGLPEERGFNGLATTTIERLSIEIPTLGANYMRFIFNKPLDSGLASTSNMLLWAEIITITEQGN